MKVIYKLILKPVFAFLYILGLSFIIPFLLSIKLPEEIVMEYSRYFFNFNYIYVAIILIAISVIGTYYLKMDLGKTCRSLAYYSLVPVFLSLITSIFGKELFISFLPEYTKELEPIIMGYINSKIPKLWILTISYVVLGIVLYFIGRKLR